MPVNIQLSLTSGRQVVGINYRMSPGVGTTPSTSASPMGAVFHVQTPLGWVDVSALDVLPGSPRFTSAHQS